MCGRRFISRLNEGETSDKIAVACMSEEEDGKDDEDEKEDGKDNDDEDE